MDNDPNQCDVYHAIVSPDAIKMDLYDCYGLTDGDERVSVSRSGKEEVRD
jgi:hypothetical protein